MQSSLWRKRAAAVALCGLMVAGLPAAGQSFNDNKPISFSIDGASATGFAKALAEALNAIIRDVYPGSDATYKPGSPVGGILNLSSGKSDLTYSGAAVEIAYAVEGKAPYKQSLKDKVKWVTTLHLGNVAHSIANKSWADKYGIKTFKDIAAKKPPMRIGMNQRGTLQSYLGLTMAIFNTYGIQESDFEKWGGSIFRSNVNTNIEAFRDGKIDVIVNGTFLRTASIIDIARNRELVWIYGDAENMEKAAKRWGNNHVVVPKSTYPFMTRDAHTVVSYSAVLAGAHVSDETVYKWLKALDSNLKRVRSVHPAMAEFDLAKYMKNPTQLGYHPGAARFYREKGWMK